MKGLGRTTRLGGIAKVLTVPAESTPIRFPSLVMGTDQTALFHLTTTTTRDMTNLAGQTSVISVASSPLSPVWGWVDSVAARTYTWKCQESAVEFFTATDHNPNPCFPARYDGHLWAFVPNGAGLTINASEWNNTATSLEVVLEYMQLIGSKRIQEYAFALTGGSGSVGSVLSNREGCWARVVTAKADVGISGLVTFEFAPGAAGFWPIVTCPSLVDVAPQLGSMRVNASALLLSNVSKTLYKNGAVTAARVGRETNVFDPDRLLTKISVTNEKLRFSGEAARGLYTFTIPTQQSMSFSDYLGDYAADYSSYGTNGYVYDLEDFLHVNACFFTVNSTDGFTLKVRHDMHLEFRSDAQIFNLDVPHYSQDDLYAVVTACSKLVPFTENPTHLAALAALTRRVISFMAPYLIPVAQQAVTQGARRANAWLEERR